MNQELKDSITKLRDEMMGINEGERGLREEAARVATEEAAIRAKLEDLIKRVNNCAVDARDIDMPNTTLDGRDFEFKKHVQYLEEILKALPALLRNPNSIGHSFGMFNNAVVHSAEIIRSLNGKLSALEKKG